MNKEGNHKIINDIIQKYSFYKHDYTYEDYDSESNNPIIVFRFYFSNEEYFSIKTDMNDIIMDELNFATFYKNSFLSRYKHIFDFQLRKYKLKQLLQ